METKVCITCNGEFPITKFKKYSSRGKQAGFRQASCNRCFYVLYTRPDVERKQAKVDAYKLSYGCADCGYRDSAWALDFDHVEGYEKLFTIGEKIGSYSLERLWAEMAKCAVVCANCHAIRTALRRVRVEKPSEVDLSFTGATKCCSNCELDLPLDRFKCYTSKDIPKGTKTSMCNRCLYVKYNRPRYEKNRDVIRQYQMSQGCLRCGYSDHHAALTFDHRPGTKKEFSVSQKIGPYSLDKAWKEIEKCDVLCRNCHNIITKSRIERVEIEMV